MYAPIPQAVAAKLPRGWSFTPETPARARFSNRDGRTCTLTADDAITIEADDNPRRRAKVATVEQAALMISSIRR